MILCCGEALIDMLPCEAVTGDAGFVPCPGGAVFNTAVALGRLGTSVGLLTGISNDLFGGQLLQALAASGVETDLAIRSDRPTTLAFLRMQDGQAAYAFHDENSAGRMVQPDDIPPVPASTKALFFGGISLATEPCGTAYEALMLREAPARVTMLDPNIRPHFIRDEATYRARLERMIAAADIVKLSDEDLNWLYGPGEIASLATGVLARGPKLVFITQGSAGAQGFSASAVESVPACAVTVVDTVGAGDTFNAGVLVALTRAGALHKDAIAEAGAGLIHACLTLGGAAAAVTVSRAGANPPWAKELS